MAALCPQCLLVPQIQTFATLSCGHDTCAECLDAIMTVEPRFRKCCVCHANQGEKALAVLVSGGPHGATTLTVQPRNTAFLLRAAATAWRRYETTLISLSDAACSPWPGPLETLGTCLVTACAKFSQLASNMVKQRLGLPHSVCPSLPLSRAYSKETLSEGWLCVSLSRDIYTPSLYPQFVECQVSRQAWCLCFCPECVNTPFTASSDIGGMMAEFAQFDVHASVIQTMLLENVVLKCPWAFALAKAVMDLVQNLRRCAYSSARAIAAVTAFPPHFDNARTARWFIEANLWAWLDETRTLLALSENIKHELLKHSDTLYTVNEKRFAAAVDSAAMFYGQYEHTGTARVRDIRWPECTALDAFLACCDVSVPHMTSIYGLFEEACGFAARATCVNLLQLLMPAMVPSSYPRTFSPKTQRFPVPSTFAHVTVSEALKTFCTVTDVPLEPLEVWCCADTAKRIHVSPSGCNPNVCSCTAFEGRKPCVMTRPFPTHDGPFYTDPYLYCKENQHFQ